VAKDRKPNPKKAKSNGVMFNLGGFFGEIVKGIKTEVTKHGVTKTEQVDHTVKVEPVQTPLGAGEARVEVHTEVQADEKGITARRVTTEEVRVEHPKQP
jgi:hypothetical protein